ncbi:Major facilitator, sugar transporter-like [Dillenia turbinata]|uniref:Major facilitator, sugar transporter-like n=1 Tax=Dillenia turbinata TaxID=194707 RepID=A0AAN8V5P2_9MAGN
MQSLTHTTVKGNLGLNLQSPRVSSGFARFRKTSTNLSIRNGVVSGASLRLRSSSPTSMGAQLASARNTMEYAFRSSAKSRSVRAHASEGDIEDVVPAKVQPESSGTVLPFVGVACLGAIHFGYHLGVVNGWVVSTTLAGATVGSFTGGSLADKFGRTKTFILDAIPLAVGAHLCATASNVETMIVGRLFCGIGIGISSAVVPLYISEISPTEIRGALGSINQLFICIGILAALVAGLPLRGDPLWWRTMFGIAVIPSVLLALGMLFSPESPRWLFQQGKTLEAEKAIKTLYGKDRVSEVMFNLRTAIVSIGAALFLFQQLAGINAVVYYSTSVFRDAGVASDILASAFVGLSNVLGTTVASSLMDRQGRKSLLILSFAGMAASMLLLSLSFTLAVLAPYSGPIAVIGTVLYVLSFSLGAGPVPALLQPEIFASRIRAKAVALSLAMHWVSNFVIGLYFLSFVNKYGISTVYLGFSMICMLAVLYISANVVETKGRSLEEIELALNAAT